MGLPVVTVASGGLPVGDNTAKGVGMAVTEATYGIPVTKVPSGGLGVVYVTPTGGSVGPSPPPGVTGIIGWWDASVTASLSLAGSTVNSMADQSGQGNTMTPESTKPTYSATGFNSKPAILYNFSNLMVSPFALGTGNTLTIWVVATMDNGGSNYARYMSYEQISGGSDGGYPGTFTLLKNSSSTTQCFFSRNSVNATASATTAYPAGHRLITTIDSSGHITLYVDGVSSGTAVSGGNWLNGGSLRVGSGDAAAGAYLVAPIAEWGVATNFSNATAVGQLDSYLKSKWGL